MTFPSVRICPNLQTSSRIHQTPLSPGVAPFFLMSSPKRLQTLASTVPTLNADYLLVTHLPNIRYLCGFTGSAGALLIGGADQMFFTDGRYTMQARDEVRGARVRIEKHNAMMAAAIWLRDKTPGTLGIEADHLTVASEARLRRFLPKPWRFRPVYDAVESLRRIKDVSETKLIRQAVNLGSSLFPSLIKTIRVGVAEARVAAKLEYSARQAGASGMSFDTRPI